MYNWGSFGSTESDQTGPTQLDGKQIWNTVHVVEQKELGNEE